MLNEALEADVAGNAAPDRNSLGYQVNLLARLLAQALKRRNGRDGILPGQFPIVLELMAYDGATQRELCDGVRIDQSTMASTLKRMERDGLIERRPCARDGRQSTVHLTPSGRDLSETAIANAREVNRVALEALDPEAQQVLREALAKMAASLTRDLE